MNKILKIKHLDKNILIILENNKEIKVSKNLYEKKYNFKEGEEIDYKKIKEEQIQYEFKIAKQKVAQLLNKTDKTKKQILDYLKKNKYNEQAIQKCINFFIDSGYINDKRYARNYVEQKKQKYGPLLIKDKLKKKGISMSIVENEVANIGSQISTIDKLANKYLKNKEMNNKNKEKLIRYLYSKGFNTEYIYEWLDKNY